MIQHLTLNAGVFFFFRGSRPVLLRNPIFAVIFSGGGGGGGGGPAIFLQLLYRVLWCAWTHLLVRYMGTKFLKSKEVLN